MSALEALYAKTDIAKGRPPLRQFGYDQLNRPPLDSELGPVPDSYVLGPGDEISVAISGSFTASHRARIDRDGRLRLPDTGDVALGGRRFEELERILTASYAEQRKDFELSAGLGRLRRIRVQVVGNVTRPGIVEIPALGTALTALRAAGGATKQGSLRRITLRRRGTAPTEFDAYGFLVSGDMTALPPLREDDVVFVPTIGATFALHGTVAHPAIYETLGEVPLGRAIAIGGGTNGFAFMARVQVESTVDGRGRLTADVQLDDNGRSRPVRDGDVIVIGAVDARQRHVVRIEGEVVRPGLFQHKPGMRVRDLVTLADGLTIDAHARQVFVSRLLAAPRSIRVDHSGAATATRRRVLVIDLGRALQGDLEHDIELAPLDLVTVKDKANATATPTVSVLGAVRNPGNYELTADLRVSDLVALADNVLPEVYYPEAELIRWQYETTDRTLQARRFRFHLGRALQAPGSLDDPLLENGDRLVIRALSKGSVEVRIEGEVRFPGTYVFGREARITDLLAAAGGLLAAADLRIARFSRRSVADLQNQRMRHLVERTRQLHEHALETMVQTGTAAEGLAAKIALENAKEAFGRIASAQAEGRIVLPWEHSDFPTSVFNLVLEEGDKLVVPRRQCTVSVLGHVFNPGSFVAEPGLTVANVLDWSGGITEEGDTVRLYVIRGNGRVQSLAQDRRPLRMRTALLPGDVVLIPRRPLERTLGARLTDLIHATRQLTEIGVLGTHVVNGGQLDVTAVIQQTVRDVLQSNGQPLLRPGR